LIPIEISFSLVLEKENMIIAVVRDITERKNAEEELKKSEEKYHSLIENANDAIISTNEDGIIISFNKTAEKMFGYVREEIVGKSITLLSPPRNREQQRKLFEKFKSTNNLYIIGRTLEGKGLKKDGQEFPFEGSVYVLEIDEEHIITVIMRDISERKNAEEERKGLLDELKDKNKELEQLFYIASHDLRSPLVNIQGFSRELEQAFKYVQSILFHSEDISSQIKETLATTLKEDIPEALQYILTSISKMDSLLSGLLRLSRMGRSALNIKYLDMNKLVLDIAKSFEYQVKETGVMLKIDKLPSCLGDETQINQVFSNLIDNAFKYLDFSRTGAIKISGRKENGHAIYHVEDNGNGIAPEHQDKIYEIFHRLNPTATQGEGLGLTIVCRILDRHDGKIWVESELGKGSKFIVSLPTN
ncbi:MAG: PAS domain S-box protein, partial [Deltaproteobacteria bacterium]|nr:PAS domain S-box protein [Deltaproteobacteria bacterium]